MSQTELAVRTKQFALRIVKAYQALPKTTEAQVIGKQVLRSGTSVAANYRSALRARSKAEFIAKLGIALEEADETLFWLELLIESRIVNEQRCSALMREASELTAIFASARKNSRI
jgi:four helix bundle protein